MTEAQATTLAEILSGNAWQSGGNIWVVLKTRTDGRPIVISDEIVCEYENTDSFENGDNPTAVISFV